MQSTSSHELFILGLTQAGEVFRPSDWAERLAGVMSQFRPGGPCAGSHLGYSPWCVPTAIGPIKCIVLHTDLRVHDARAWDFCLNFAKDNNLQVTNDRPNFELDGIIKSSASHPAAFAAETQTKKPS